MNVKSSPILVLGAGSWGTALSLQLARNGNQVLLWDFALLHIRKLKQEKANQQYLPGIFFPDNIVCIEELTEGIDRLKGFPVQDILIVVPSHAFESLLMSLKPLLNPESRLLWATKGLTQKGEFLSDAFEGILGSHYPYGVISGPSFATEVAQGLPTSVSLATTNHAFTSDLFIRFHGHGFQVYSTEDIMGVELGGAVKNVIAIAVGMFEGLGYGSNARSALITRGLAELMGLSEKLGALPKTLMGLSGLGDLVLTCTDNQSRNRRFGLAIGLGQDPVSAEKSIGQVVEGKGNAALVLQLAKKYEINLPICNLIYQVLYQKVSPNEAVKRFIHLPPAIE